MAMRKITADRIYDGLGNCYSNRAIVVREDETVHEIIPTTEIGATDLERHIGVITPGFVNAHCHLELSHMKGVVPSGTGLIAFIKDVVTLRGAPEEEIQAAIAAADVEMWENGIVAVGDISNVTDTFAVKSASRIHYHTFVEMFDFLQEGDAQKSFENYYKVYQSLKDDFGLPGNVVPHAPYSVSKNLFRLLKKENAGLNVPVSIHNMETPAESELFVSNSGELISFYEGFGIPTHSFNPTGKTSVYYALENMDAGKTTLLVHNTLCGKEEIEATQKWNSHAYFVTCPSANLYIENRLPQYRKFLDAGSKMAIGTDSLTSNWCLSVLEEMKVIARYQSFVPFDQLVIWATQNGAEALKLDGLLGSIQKGKKPGLNLLYDDSGANPEKLGAEVKVKKLL